MGTVDPTHSEGALPPVAPDYGRENSSSSDGYEPDPKFAVWDMYTLALAERDPLYLDVWDMYTLALAKRVREEEVAREKAEREARRRNAICMTPPDIMPIDWNWVAPRPWHHP